MHRSSGANAVAEPSVFTTDTLPLQQRLDAWNAQFGTLNDIAAPEPERSTLSARTEHWMLGDMLLSLSRTAPAIFTRTRQHLRRDGLDHWVVRMLLHGSSRIHHAGATDAIAAGQPFLFRLDAPWETAWQDAAWISLCFPRDAYPGLAAACAMRGPGPLRGEAAPVLADFLLLLERQIRIATPARLPLLASATGSVLHACLAMESGAQPATPDDIATAQFERLRALIHQHLHSPSFGPQRLANLAGMSRSALYRLFESRGGVGHYIQGMRMRRALALLSDPTLAQQPIASLAERAGFFDPSAFSRAFRAAHGCSPREARLAALAGLPISGVQHALLPEEDYGALLRGIGQGRRTRLRAA
jgi:AraC-like DNA-binding protein